MVKNYIIREMSLEDRPREKLKEFGAKSLSDKEVLAILLRTGTREKNVIELASMILDDVGGIRALKDTTFNELTKHKGVGYEKAIHILANIEFARRIYSTEVPNVTCNSPESIAKYLKSSLENLMQEVFVVLDIDTKGKILQQREVFKGSLAMSVVHPREIFKNAIRNSASSIVCVHNHPSGNASPSFEDIKTTINLLNVGDIIGIDMLDHIIVSKGGYCSIKRVLSYFKHEEIDYENKEITEKQFRFIEKKYKIISEY